MKKTSSISKESDPRMYEEENTDDLELGDMGDSADEGAEADIHNEGVSLREVLESSNEPIGDDADSIDNLKGEEFPPAEGNGVVQLVGAPDGWIPPGPPPTWAEMLLNWATLKTLAIGLCIHFVLSTRQGQSIQDISLLPEQWLYLPMNMVNGS